MYCSHLLILEDTISKEQIQKLDSYLSGLTGSSINNITISKVAKYMNIETNLATKIMLSCQKNGIFDMTYAIRCPECGTLIKRVDKLSQIPKDKISCYACDSEDLEITKNDIEVLFRLIDPLVFNCGQQELIHGNSSANSPVAHEDTLENILLAGGINEYLFSPTDDEYKELEKMYEAVFEITPTKKAKGDTLERLTAYLFNLSPAFKACGIKTSTNQIDCYVRNTMCMDFGVLNTIGERILIECKNEGKAPSGGYMSKLHSIICNINGKRSMVKLGIIVSKEKGPSTFKSLATKMYLSDAIIMISICGDELGELIKSRRNLLELIERKIDEIAFDATTDLRQAGLYTT